MKKFPRWLEEFIPFAAYVSEKRRIDAELNRVTVGLELSDTISKNFDNYKSLAYDELEKCLGDEHIRAKYLADKTFKFGATLATALTVVSLGTVLYGDKLSGTGWEAPLFMFTCLAFIYIAAGGVLGLSAMRVQRSYGTGTAAVCERKDKTDTELVTLAARDIALQERANNIHTMRNEAAFMSLRNGFVILILTFSGSLIGLSGLADTMQKTEPFRKKITALEASIRELRGSNERLETVLRGNQKRMSELHAAMEEQTAWSSVIEHEIEVTDGDRMSSESSNPPALVVDQELSRPELKSEEEKLMRK